MDGWFLIEVKEIFQYFCSQASVTMSAKVIINGDPISPTKMPSPEPTPATNNNNNNAIDVESVKCACCGLTEECTLPYIAKVCERYHGRWICGLCSEAIKDEVARSGRSISTEEALDRHVTFSKSFRNPKKHLILAMRQLMLRSLDSPRAMRSGPANPRGALEGGGVLRKLARAESCFPDIAG